MAGDDVSAVCVGVVEVEVVVFTGGVAVCGADPEDWADGIAVGVEEGGKCSLVFIFALLLTLLPLLLLLELLALLVLLPLAFASGLAQNFTLPQLHVTKKCSRKCTSDTGSW